MTLTKEKRNEFVEAAGVRYAGIGGMSFGTYTSCEQAFEVFSNFLLYRKLNFNVAEDYENFKRGFDLFQKYRVHYQLTLRRADAVMKEVLAGIDYNAPNYLYENKEPE